MHRQAAFAAALRAGRGAALGAAPGATTARWAMNRTRHVRALQRVERFTGNLTVKQVMRVPSLEEFA